MSTPLLIQKIQAKQRKDDLPLLSTGDLVCIYLFIQEGNKQRIQTYQGTLIARSHCCSRSTITVRRIFQGIRIERVFLTHSPSIQSIQVRRLSKVRRSKLYYLRKLKGKKTRLGERAAKL